MIIKDGTEVMIPLRVARSVKSGSHPSGGRELIPIPYVITKLLGDGGFGHVYQAKKATDKVASAPDLIAIKIFGKEDRPDEDRIKEQQRNAEESLAKSYFQHVTRLNLEIAGPRGKGKKTLYCMTCEFIPGNELESYDLSSYSFSDCVVIATQLALQLYAINSTSPVTGPGLIHLDLSARNVLLARYRTPADRIALGASPGYYFNTRIIDVGLAIPNTAPDKLQESAFESPLKSSFVIKNNPLIAPEEIAEPAHVGTKTDVLAFGFLLLQMFNQDAIVYARKKSCNLFKKHDLAATARILSHTLETPPNLLRDGQVPPPLIEQELMARFIQWIFRAPLLCEEDLKSTSKLLEAYQMRPQSLECLQFLTWLHQICILSDRGERNSDRFKILVTKCRLLLEKLWWKQFENVDLETQPGLYNYIYQLPIDESIDAKCAHDLLVPVKPIIPIELQEKLNEAKLPIAVFEEAITEGKLLLALLEKLQSQTENLLQLFRIIKYSELLISLQNKLLAQPQQKITFTLYLIVCLTQPSIRTWVETYLEDPQKPPTIDTLNNTELFDLYKLTFSQEDILLYLVGRNNIELLQARLVERLFRNVNQYQVEIQKVCDSKGPEYHRGWWWGSTVGEKKKAVEALKISFLDFFSSSDSSTFFKTNINPYKHALNHGELGKLALPILAELNLK